MSSRGEIQKQLSQLLTTTKAQGYKFEDVIPPEMLAHFEEMHELTSARKSIAESDMRIASLEASLEETQQNLREKQTELDNLPSDVLALKIDLQQAQRSTEYYRELNELAQTRSERAQARLLEAQKKLLNQAEQARNIARLQEALEYQTLLVQRLSKESAALEAHYNTLTASHASLLALKDDEIKSLRADNATNTQIIDVHDSLIDAIESSSQDTTSTLNTQSLHLAQHDLFSASLISIIQPLVSYFSDTTRVISLYRSIFHNLADINRPIDTDLPAALDDLLDSANDRLRDYADVAAGLRDFMMGQRGELARERLWVCVEGLAGQAGLMNVCLEDIKVDIVGFLERLKNQPDMGLAFKGQGRFSGLKRLSLFGSRGSAKRSRGGMVEGSEKLSGKAPIGGGVGVGIEADSRRSSVSTLVLGGWSPRDSVLMGELEEGVQLEILEMDGMDGV